MLTTIEILTISLLPGINKQRLQRLVYKTKINQNSSDDLFNKVNTIFNLHVDKKQYEECELKSKRIIKDALSRQIYVLTPSDNHFPKRLEEIPDPPCLLYAKGNMDILNKEASIAVVGTRQPTEFGKQFATNIGIALAEKNVVVISGLAIGCDSCAHNGCLQKKGLAIAVLAHGLDTVYPVQNRVLADNILTADGCLLSEYMPGVPPQRHQFVERNRLQSGLAEALIVIESAKSGGTMHHVRICAEQGRRIGCIKHSIEQAQLPQIVGNAIFLQKGAYPISNMNDFIRFTLDASLGVFNPNKNSTIIDFCKRQNRPERQKRKREALAPIENQAKSNLTKEQLDRIEKNRQEARAKRVRIQTK